MAMNTHLRAVKLTLKGKPTVSLDQMSVRGSNIRWRPIYASHTVHLPVAQAVLQTSTGPYRGCP